MAPTTRASAAVAASKPARASSPELALAHKRKRSALVSARVRRKQMTPSDSESDSDSDCCSARSSDNDHDENDENTANSDSTPARRRHRSDGNPRATSNAPETGHRHVAHHRVHHDPTRTLSDAPRTDCPNSAKAPPPPGAAIALSENQPATPLAMISAVKTFFTPSADPGRLVGREKERAAIVEFLESAAHRARHCNDSDAGQSLYVSGVPGTGKSAMIDQLLDEFTSNQTDGSQYLVAKINCMQFNDAKSVYRKIMSEFGINECAFGTISAEPYRTLERAFGYMEGGDKIAKSSSASNPKKRTQHSLKKAPHDTTVHILVLDEIDQLATRDNAVLYRIFEWTTLPNTSLVLIGIANALDLLQRHLPRLDGMPRGPQLLNFTPYTPGEISEIIKGRLRMAHAALSVGKQSDTSAEEVQVKAQPPFMQATAIELCARKAAGTGDLRKALDLVRLSLEVVESELKKSTTKPVLSAADPNTLSMGRASKNSTASKPVDPDEIPKVSVAHVLKASAAAVGQAPLQKIKGLATQQKAVLVALVDLLGISTGANQHRCTGTLKEPVVGNLHDAYVSLLNAKGLIKPVTRTEFGDILSLFESVGLVAIGKAREERQRRVRLDCRAEHVAEAVQDDPVLWAIWAARRH
ncbi:AAA ATPase [Entophlyctis luteolus]|nr:AAA ATPase [Entophlyctis luteolus]